MRKGEQRQRNATQRHPKAATALAVTNKENKEGFHINKFRDPGCIWALAPAQQNRRRRPG
jgi:hypothetical protein